MRWDIIHAISFGFHVGYFRVKKGSYSWEPINFTIMYTAEQIFNTALSVAEQYFTENPEEKTCLITLEGPLPLEITKQIIAMMPPKIICTYLEGEKTYSFRIKLL
jgi:hypothetical protein